MPTLMISVRMSGNNANEISAVGRYFHNNGYKLAMASIDGVAFSGDQSAIEATFQVAINGDQSAGYSFESSPVIPEQISECQIDDILIL